MKKTLLSLTTAALIATTFTACTDEEAIASASYECEVMGEKVTYSLDFDKNTWDMYDPKKDMSLSKEVAKESDAWKLSDDPKFEIINNPDNKNEYSLNVKATSSEKGKNMDLKFATVTKVKDTNDIEANIFDPATKRKLVTTQCHQVKS